MLRQREPRVRDRKYLALVARMPSVISGRWPVQVAHLRYGDPAKGKPHTGMGEKPDDKWTLPLTPDEHMHGVRSQHANNEQEWWEGHGIDPIQVCIDLYEAYQKYWPDQIEAEERMRRIALTARGR